MQYWRFSGYIVTLLFCTIVGRDANASQCGMGSCPAQETEAVDLETEAVMNEVSLLQMHLQLQGNAQPQDNHGSIVERATTLTKDSLSKGSIETKNEPWYKRSYDAAIEEMGEPIMGIFNRRPVTQDAKHGKTYKYPMAQGDSWPSAPMVIIELLLVCLFLLRQRLGFPSMVPTKAAVSSPIRALSTGDAAEPRLLHHRISAIAKTNPSRLALIDGDHRETFAELQAAAFFVARHLVEERNVKPCSRTPVGVCAEGRYMMHAIFGIVNTGNPYVPLPPNLPTTQRDFIVEDSNIQVVLVDPSSASIWDGRKEASPAFVLVNKMTNNWKPSWEVSENDLAYVLYTSGSTGKPKGVLAPHSAYWNRCKWMWDTYPTSEGEVGIQKTAIGWIDHVQEVFGYLGGGAALVMAPPEARTNPVKLINLCKEHSVSRLVLVPSLCRVIVGAFGAKLAEELPRLRFWLCSGEPFPVDLLQAVLKSAAPGSMVLNTYGTTEVAGDVTWAAYDSSSTLPSSTIVPVGKAIPPNIIHLLDPETLQHVPPGETGEIFVEGPHLAVGYHNRQDENDTRFVELSGLGIKRAFRTGDFGKLDEDQMIQYAGRKDQQVKVHGQRVEVLQVEFVLGQALLSLQPEGDKDVKPPCAVMAIPSEQDLGSYRLLAFVEVPNPAAKGAGVEKEKLIPLMKESLLPAHIPEAFIAVKALPRLVNGKLDRMALKQVAEEHASKEEESGVKEEVDSFGQIRRILVEHVDGKRIVATVNTLSLFVVVASHWLFEAFVPGFDLGIISPKWTVTLATHLFLDVHDVSCLMAGVGALNGMGDDERFKFSVWEPAFLFCWFLIHVFYEFFLPRECWMGHLYFLPVLFCARVWSILWHKFLTMCGAVRSSVTDTLSILLVSGVWLLRDSVLDWWAPVYEALLKHGPAYAGGDWQLMSVYLFGFYAGPGIVKKSRQMSLALRSAAGLFMLIASCVALMHDSLDQRHGIGGVTKLLFRFMFVAGSWVCIASLPAWFDLGLPGLANLAVYVLHMNFMPAAIHGFSLFGLNFFPSLPDLLLQANKAPPPFDGTIQLITMCAYMFLFFVFIANLTVSVTSLAAEAGSWYRETFAKGITTKA